MAGSLALYPILHSKVNPQDLDKEGFVLKKEQREVLFSYRGLDGLAEGPMKLSRKASLGSVGVEMDRSLLFVDNKIFALYRDRSISVEDGSLGVCHNGKVRLAQDLVSGEWIAVKIITEGQLQEADNLRRLGRLVGHIPPNQEGAKEYLLQTLLYGESASQECIDLESSVRIFLTALRELERLHRSGLAHGDCGIHNFVYNRESNHSLIVDFEGSNEELEGQYQDNDQLLSELLSYLELSLGSCDSVKKRKELLDHPILFDMAVKISSLLRTAEDTGCPIQDLAPIIELMQSAYDCQFNPSAVAEERYFSHFSAMQNFTDQIKRAILERFEMPICDYIEKVKTESAAALGELERQIEQYQKESLLIGEMRWSAAELDALSVEDKILHYTACKERMEEQLLRIKNSSFFPGEEVEKRKRDRNLIHLIGGAAVIEECARQLKTLSP